MLKFSGMSSYNILSIPKPVFSGLSIHPGFWRKHRSEFLLYDLQIFFGMFRYTFESLTVSFFCIFCFIFEKSRFLLTWFHFLFTIIKYDVEYSTISDIHIFIKIFDFSTFEDDSCKNKVFFSFNGSERPSKKELMAIW